MMVDSVGQESDGQDRGDEGRHAGGNLHRHPEGYDKKKQTGQEEFH